MRSHALTITAALLLGSAASGAAPNFRCDDIFNRVALLDEHQFCAQGEPVDSLSVHFRSKVWPETYEIKVSEIKDAAVKQRALDFGHQESERVPVVARPKPAWLRTKWRFDHSSTEATRYSLPLQCVIGPGLGHAELSTVAARASGWSKASAELLGLASRDADDLEWENLAAHALTPEPGQGGAVDTTSAIGALEKWLTTNVERTLSECALDRTPEAIYVLGYVLHSVQDLALHAGMTRAEQSALIHARSGVESEPKRVARAASWTKATLQQLEQQLPVKCVKAMKAHHSATRPPNVAQQYFGKRDRSAKAMEAFQALGAQKPAPSSPTTWFSSNDAAAANAFHLLHVRDVVKKLAPVP